MLALLGGKPLVQWAYEGAKSCGHFDEVAVATDSSEIAGVVQAFGGQAVMTSPDCQSGTDRLAELLVSKKITSEIWVNWQGDEPFIDEKTIADLLQSIEDKEFGIWTLKKRIEDREEIASKNVVKVVTDQRGKALYFSRSPIPSSGTTYKHVGLYAFRSETLRQIQTLPVAPIEKEEKLEQLRFLYHGLPIQVHETEQEIFGIDTKEELAKAEQMCYTRS